MIYKKFENFENLTEIFVGTNLYQIAVHEIGHTLGMEHAESRSSVMFPAYEKYDQNFNFDRDDIAKIQVDI